MRCQTKDALVAGFEPLPEHEESHTGPYGVEAPLQWEFVVTTNKVTLSVKEDSKDEACRDTSRYGDVSGEVGSKTEKS